MGHQIALMSFLVEGNLLVNIFLVIKFVGDDFEAIFMGKQMVGLLGPSPIALFGTERNLSKAAHVRDQMERLLWP